jgi:addiction module RelE/StbE family toxin
MAEVVWSEPALSDLDAIADYIALDNPDAASLLVRRVLGHVGQLAAHPLSGSKLPELKGWRYRQIIEPPCRVIYRHERRTVWILHVVRSERLLRRSVLAVRSKITKR